MARFIPLATLALIPIAASCSTGRTLTADQVGPGDGYPPLPAQPVASNARSDFGMVVTGSPEATRAGVHILEQGGNAIDAAVAAALTLGVSDVDASGIGGMTYMLIRLADGRTTAIDGTPRAPLAVDRAALLEIEKAGQSGGYPLTAVPTTLAVLQTAVTKYGSMEMGDLLQPAIEVAENGYDLSPIQIVWTTLYYKRVMIDEYFRRIATEDGTTVDRPGKRYCRPDLARTLRRLAEEGVDSFYRGNIAEEIEADMIARGGSIRRTDLAVTRIREVEPLVSTYRGREIYTFPPPGGGAAVARTLDILESYPSDFLAKHSVERMQVMIEAARLGRAGALESDPNFAAAGDSPSTDPQKELARSRAQLISPGRAIPTEFLAPEQDPRCQNRSGDSTTHLSVADQFGNVVSMTQTIGGSFGAKVATPGLGFPYNNLLWSFNYDKPHCPGFLLPRSEIVTDMAPTIVVEDGTVIAALGAPGSSRIPSLIATVVSNIVDSRMELAEAVAAPRALFGGTYGARASIEILDPITAADADAIEAMGFDEVERCVYPPTSSAIVTFGGTNALAFDPTDRSWVGVGDARRWGSAKGPRVIAEAAPQGTGRLGPHDR